MPPTTQILDTANRADEGPPPSTSWTNITNGMKVVSNTFKANVGASISYWNPSTFVANCEVFGTVAIKCGDGSLMAVALRSKDVGSIATLDAYSISVEPAVGTDVIKIVRIDNAVSTALATYNQEVTAGDGVWLTAVGSTLTAYYRSGAGGAWTLLGSVTDATYGAAGNLFMSCLDLTGAWDDFGGGIMRLTKNTDPQPLGVFAGVSRRVANTP